MLIKFNCQPQTNYFSKNIITVSQKSIPDEITALISSVECPLTRTRISLSCKPRNLRTAISRMMQASSAISQSVNCVENFSQAIAKIYCTIKNNNKVSNRLKVVPMLCLRVPLISRVVFCERIKRFQRETLHPVCYQSGKVKPVQSLLSRVLLGPKRVLITFRITILLSNHCLSSSDCSIVHF